MARHPDIWKFPQHRLDELDANSEIHWPKKAKGIPRRRSIESKGVPVQDVITDIGKREATDYPSAETESSGRLY